MLLHEFAEFNELSFSVVKHFTSRRITDGDLLWLVAYPDDRFLSDLGFTPGQAFNMRKFAKEKIADCDAEIARQRAQQ